MQAAVYGRANKDLIKYISDYFQRGNKKPVNSKLAFKSGRPKITNLTLVEYLTMPIG